MEQQELSCLQKLLQLQNCSQPHQFADFCRQLKRSHEVLDPQEASELLNLFCRFYWKLDTLQKTCFEDICSIWINASRATWIKIIPQLLSKSIVCNDLIFMAKLLLEELNPEEIKALDKVYPIYWTKDDEYTSITAEEYAYRQSKGLRSWFYEYPPLPNGKITKDFRRPSSINDFKCFQAMLEILHLSKQESCFFMSGYAD